ncbi:hypothetical protein [Allochromatium tepidum]|uniref:hypothetical protein n=1 Tax=Allochromatium tepidum TaxID=553982 RepID=UPI001BCCEC28|nr:hypothetical protein [Allochromatium tepidum]
MIATLAHRFAHPSLFDSLPPRLKVSQGQRGALGLSDGLTQTRRRFDPDDSELRAVGSIPIQGEYRQTRGRSSR